MFVFSERVVALSVDHFNQNGNIKNISHIDAEANPEIENGENTQKAIQTATETLNKKASLEISDIELASREPKSSEKKESATIKEKTDGDKDESRCHLFRYPKHKGFFRQIIWIIIWPAEFLFFLTIPNCEYKRFKNLFPLTFLMCIVWIGSLSYLVAWMITIVGKIFQKISCRHHFVNYGLFHS